MTPSLGPSPDWEPCDPADELRAFRDLFALATLSVLLLAIGLFMPRALVPVFCVCAGAWGLWMLTLAVAEQRRWWR